MDQKYLETVLGRQEFPELLSPDISHLPGKKVLVTGASGSVGKALVKRLRELSLECIATNRLGNENCVQMDVTDGRQVSSVIAHYNPQIIVHLAAKTNVPWCEENLEDAVHTNALSVHYIGEAMSAGARLIFASSSMAVPDFNVYGTTKFLGEQALKHIQNACAIRFFNIIPTLGFLIDKWTQMPSDKLIPVPEGISRTFISKNEAIGAILYLMNNTAGNGIFRIAGPKAQQLSDIACRLYPHDRLDFQEPLLGGKNFEYPVYNDCDLCDGEIVRI